MRFIALASIALAVSASALVTERDLRYDARKKYNAQTTWSKFNKSSLTSRR
jgi:NAD/NADP transhydrogenase alpha subunit